MSCQSPGCQGRILDGYCDICGLPAGGGTKPVSNFSSGRNWRLAELAPRTELGLGFTHVEPAPAVVAEKAVIDYAAFNPHPSLAPGTLVADQYRVYGCLAKGGMGWIYLAADERVQGRWVVLKGVLSGSADERLSADIEQRYLARVDHPNIVEIYNVVTVGAETYIVMEYVGGRSLAQYQKELEERSGSPALDLDDALALIIGILPAVEYLHRQGLVYCDFKPANVIQVGDSVKLIDLGSVRSIGNSDEPIFGTPSFQAPEAPTTGPTIVTDIFAIGKTLQILTDGAAGSVVAKTAISSLIGRCCAIVDERFHSINELYEAALTVLKLMSGRIAPASTEYFTEPTVTSFTVTSALLPQAIGGESAWADVYNQGLTAFDNGDHTTAESAFRSICEFFPGQIGPLLALAYAQISKRPASAINVFLDLVANPEPWRSAANIGLALAYRSTNQLAAAVRTAADIAPTSPVYEIAQFYRVQWLIDSATTLAETDLEIPYFRLEWRMQLERALLAKRLSFTPKDRASRRRLELLDERWAQIAAWNS